MSAWKFEADLEPGALARLLRELADVLEGAQDAGRGALASLPLDDLRKLVLVARAKGAAPGAAQGFAVALKAKRAHEVRVPRAGHEAGHGGGHGGKLSGEAPGGRGKGQGVPSASGEHLGARGGATGRNYGAAKGPRAADAGAREREKYRQLKKSMQADYKTLRAAAEAGRMPGQDVLESFLALSETMTEMAQPLKNANGPEAAELARANAVFLEDARALRRAVSARDATALAEVLARLERRKAACHAQFR